MESSVLRSLPPEVLHSIFAKVEPHCLAPLRACCRALDNFIKNDILLWKELYLTYFVSSVIAPVTYPV